MGRRRNKKAKKKKGGQQAVSNPTAKAGGLWQHEP